METFLTLLTGAFLVLLARAIYIHKEKIITILKKVLSFVSFCVAPWEYTREKKELRQFKGSFVMTPVSFSFKDRPTWIFVPADMLRSKEDASDIAKIFNQVANNWNSVEKAWQTDISRDDKGKRVVSKNDYKHFLTDPHYWIDCKVVEVKTRKHKENEDEDSETEA